MEDKGDGTLRLRLKSSVQCRPGLDPKADQKHAGCVSASEEMAKYIKLPAPESEGCSVYSLGG